MRHGSTILVGRESELRAVDHALAAAQTARGGAIFMIGESGIGKSRLAAAAAELAYTAGMGLMRGRASAIGPIGHFRPLTEAILSLLRTEPVMPAGLGAYGPVLGRLVPEWPTPSGGDGESLVVLAEAVLRLTGLVGRDRGCLLALDDLHDADPETLAVLEYLVDNLELQPTLLLGAIRDQDCAALALARAAAQRGNCQLVELGRLSRNDLHRMAGACLDVEPERLPVAAGDLLWAGSAGNPFIAEELVTTMIDDGVLVNDGENWTLAEHSSGVLTAGMARPLARRVADFGPHTRELLSVAATFGPRFPLEVVQRVTGMSDRDLLSLLQDDVAGQLVAPDEQTAGWYAFHHQLGREAVLAQLPPDEYARLAGMVADAVEEVYPGLPGEWCEVAAALRQDAGERTAAGRLFAEVGGRALAMGEATSAVALLDRAWELLAHDDVASTRVGTLEQLLLALAEAGLVERALASVGILDEIGGLTSRRRAHLHTRLAWAAIVAGRIDDAQVQVEAARALLGPDASAEDIAPIDVVAAHLALDLAGPNQLAVAERMARQAVTVAESAPLPAVACQAWQLLGAITRHHDLDEATACLERSRSLAVQHGLPIWEIHALIRLGNDDALRHGGLHRLERVRDQASRVGAVTARYQAEASIALHSVLYGEYHTAHAIVDEVLTATTRLKLLETTQYVLLVSAVLAGHQGRRREMESALAGFQRWQGDLTLHAPRVYGLAGAFCALLEEDRAHALDDLARAVDSEDTGSSVFHLSGRHGLHVLLQVLSGVDLPGHQEATGNPASALRWDRQFTLFARSVLYGRTGKETEAGAAVEDALRTSEPYAMARHLCLRLVGEAALDDGWGDPVSWLRTAEDYFHRTDVPAVAGACRALLRRAGARVPQRRTGAEGIPAELRSAGVTVREHEVLGLLVGRLSNREIADRLHLSPRTVERHVCSLITKTGLPNRIALGEFAAGLTNGAA